MTKYIIRTFLLLRQTTYTRYKMRSLTFIQMIISIMYYLEKSNIEIDHPPYLLHASYYLKYVPNLLRF